MISMDSALNFTSGRTYETILRVFVCTRKLKRIEKCGPVDPRWTIKEF